MRGHRRRRDGFLRDASGVSAVEFAILLPILISLMFGGFAFAKAIAISRKVTITTRALADLTSQYTTMSQTDMNNVKNAATQIVAPFSSSPLSMRISEIYLNSAGTKATVTFSTVQGTAFTAFTAGSTFTSLPTQMPAGSSFILAETSYSYQPGFGASVVGTIALSDHIYMLPRLSTSVTYSGS